MSHQHGPWTIQQTREKYRNAFIQVNEDQVLQPDGKPGIYGTVAMKPGVAILPIDEDGNVYLIRQFRYALGKESIEVVAGALEDNESPLVAAQREMQEELGIQAEDWIDLGMFNLDTSIVHCPVHLFLAKHLNFVQPQREGTETMETCKMTLMQAFKMVMESHITHAPSCILILKALYFHEN